MMQITTRLDAFAPKRRAAHLDHVPGGIDGGKSKGRKPTREVYDFLPARCPDAEDMCILRQPREGPLDQKIERVAQGRHPL